jgi:hypothetical protein
MKNLKISSLDAYNKIRKVWEINPRVRIKPSDKKYSRRKTKQALKKELRENLD